MHHPGSEQELCEIVRTCAAEKRPFHAIGSGTKLHHGPASAPDAETLCLRKLNGIPPCELANLVVTAQAGVRLTDLQAELAKQNQWLPIDPPYAEATIGGILATHSSGPRRLAYGAPRELLTGLRVVRPDGVAVKSGGCVVKNVTGYDLAKLHVGAFGTLGIIVEASLKLRVRPEVTAAIVFTCDSFAEAHRLLLKIHGSKLRPVALEADGKRAIVGVEGTRKVLERHERDLKEYSLPFEVIEGETVWNELREPAKGCVRVRIAAKPHDLPNLVPEGAHLRAHVGSGIARVDLEPAGDLPERIAGWHAKASAAGGYAVTESAPLDLPDRERLPWGFPGSRLAKALKESVDPAGISNRGRMVV